MFELVTRLHVAGLKGREVTEFLARCDDAAYQRWWPGTHLRLHTVSGEPGRVGSMGYMDEYVGKRRVRAGYRIREHVPGRRLVLGFRHAVRLPLRLILEFADDESGVSITHTIRAGFTGRWRILDPLFRLWFTPRFAVDMDAHARTEFPLLRDLLHGTK